MEFLSKFIEFAQKFIIWWVIISPWEKGIHVRCGKKKRVVGPGMCLRIPIIDSVYIQTTRTRIAQMPPQTLTTLDGKTITLSANIGYSIVDIDKLYMTLFHPDQTLCSMLMGFIAEVVREHRSEDLTPDVVERGVVERCKAGAEWGIHFEFTKITGWAYVRTYRLISESSMMYESMRTDKAQS